MQKNLFSPRLGVTYRMTDSRGAARRLRHHERSVLAGPADAHEPSDPDRTSWTRPHTRSRRCGRIEEGIPTIPDADLGSGIIPVPGNVTVVTLPTTSSAAACESWNAAFEKELLWGLRRRGRLRRHPPDQSARACASRTGRRLAAAATAGSWSRGSDARPRRYSSRRSATRTTTRCRRD